jgi:hypothetical protein
MIDPSYNKHMQFQNNQTGAINKLAIPLVVSVIFVMGLAGFGLWSYSQYLDQKNNTDSKIAKAVSEANEVQKAELEKDFAEREKSPFSTWTSAGAIGSIELTYPRTWSAYVEEKDVGTKPLDGYFHPKAVKGDNNTKHALRIQVDESKYDTTVASFEKNIKTGAVSSSPITKAGVTGIRFDGEIGRDYSGAIVIFQLRDKTVRIWTESEAYLPEFNNIVLKNLTFVK